MAATGEHPPRPRGRFSPGSLVAWGLAALGILTKVKFLGTFVTMAATIGSFALFFDWRFAVGLVGLILVHELGHAGVGRALGLGVSAPTFVPFLGAFVRVDERDARSSVAVSLAGPVIGGLAALAAWGIGVAIDSDFWRALAYTGFLLNLFNLIPVPPLDGGRIAEAVSTRLWIAGLAGLAVLCYVRFNPLLLILLLLGALQVWGRLAPADADEDEVAATAAARGRRAPLGAIGGPVDPEAEPVPPTPTPPSTRELAGGVDRVVVGLVYFGAAALLWLGMHLSHVDPDLLG